MDRRSFLKIVLLALSILIVPRPVSALVAESRLPLSFPFTFAGSEQVDADQSYRIFLPIIKD